MIRSMPSRRAALAVPLAMPLALTLVLWTTASVAAPYPNKPIRVYVPFPPGGGTDVIAREVTQAVATSTKWVFVIENKPGAGGNLGVDAAAKSAKDGYTLVLGQSSNLSINPWLYARMPYDPAKDLAPIGLVARAPLVLVTSADSKLKTIADAVAAAKAQPGALNYASAGNGTVAHLATELFQKAAGVKLQHVPYKGVGQALTDVVSGNVDLYMSTTPSLLGHIRQGKLRPLAVTSDKRLPELPNVPTLAESGFKGAESATWFGFLAPAGTPPEIVARLNSEFTKALQQPALVKKLGDEGVAVTVSTPDQFSQLIRQDLTRWGKVVKDAGIKID